MTHSRLRSTVEFTAHVAAGESAKTVACTKIRFQPIPSGRRFRRHERPTDKPTDIAGDIIAHQPTDKPGVIHFPAVVCSSSPSTAPAYDSLCFRARSSWT